MAAPSSTLAFTLEDVLSAPFPSELRAAPNGTAVAWVLNERGARNIWVAEAPEWRGRRVTGYGGDDGQDLGSLQWTPDSKGIVYVRGGDLEFPNSADPNPGSVASGVQQELWLVRVAGKTTLLGQGHSPAVARNWVAYVNAGQIWAAALDGTEKPKQLVKSRGTASALRFSGDGSKLAFVSGRVGHSFVGVYDVASKNLQYLDASVDNDMSPEWSPDGREVAYIRIAASKESRYGAKRVGEPWSVRVADAKTGAGRELWKAAAGQGSVFRTLAAPGNLFWVGERVVFPWECDGWLHLYAVASKGGAATLLTPGEFEVEHVSAAGGGDLLISSNQGDIQRRHIWRVPVAGGAPKAVTSGSGIEWTPVAVGSAVAFLHSDARKPGRAAILLGAETRDLAPYSIPEQFPEKQLVEPRLVTITAADGMQIPCQLFMPAGGGKHPALAFFHGGSRRQMLPGWHYMYYYSNSYGMNQYLASKGYIVLSVNYRSGVGYGLNFREAINYGASGASEYNDVAGAGVYLRSRLDVDTARIGLWGGSYGGFLTALGLGRASDLFAAGVDFHGVHDWSNRPSLPEAVAKVAFASSPMASVKTWRSPVLLIHGDDDRNVAFNQTVDLVEALRKQGVYFEQLIFPDEIHDFLRQQDWLRAYHATEDFFERKLLKR